MHVDVVADAALSVQVVGEKVPVGPPPSEKVTVP